VIIAIDIPKLIAARADAPIVGFQNLGTLFGRLFQNHSPH
jgi:hypothetical protein